MVRVEALVAWGSLVGFVLLMALALLVSAVGAPNAASCIEPRPGPRAPAMSVEVTSNRNGHIVERNLFGCTFYFYELPPGTYR